MASSSPTARGRVRPPGIVPGARGLVVGMTSEPIVLDQSAVPLETWSDPVRGVVGFRTLVGDGTTATDSLTAGVTEMGPGGWLGHHRHEPAEIYYVLEGTGTVVLAGQEHPVHAGS